MAKYVIFFSPTADALARFVEKMRRRQSHWQSRAVVPSHSTRRTS